MSELLQFLISIEKLSTYQDSLTFEGVWQKDELGGRGRAYGEGVEQDFSKSKLRWGIGKLIAHAPVRPRVVPFAHV